MHDAADTPLLARGGTHTQGSGTHDTGVGSLVSLLMMRFHCWRTCLGTRGPGVPPSTTPLVSDLKRGRLKTMLKTDGGTVY